MTTEIPFEITHVSEHLRRSFTGILPEATSGSADAKEINFLSRSLAAFVIHKLSGCALNVAADSVVDGGGDGGIDAIHYAETTNILWVVQSKFHRNGRGEPDLGSVSKFKNGLENLLLGTFDAFQTNTAWQQRITQLQIILSTNNALQVRAVLVYSGINLVSEDRRRLFEDVRIR
ncbi:MAG TPA: hypothetical protein VK983_00875, partial [Candidatus Limnocylindrales bacterium]|nr:hypothetical protein [Candidatus Limnocylindrales bacterium]